MFYAMSGVFIMFAQHLFQRSLNLYFPTAFLIKSLPCFFCSFFKASFHLGCCYVWGPSWRHALHLVFCVSFVSFYILSCLYMCVCVWFVYKFGFFLGSFFSLTSDLPSTPSTTHTISWLYVISFYLLKLKLFIKYFVTSFQISFDESRQFRQFRW